MAEVDTPVSLVDLAHRSGLVVAATRRLLELAELFAVPVVLTEQYPAGLGETRAEVLADFDALTVPKRRLAKTSFGCCGDERFEEILGELRPGLEPSERQLIVAGIEAHVCVLQTAIDLINAGYEVHVPHDAVNSRRAADKLWALERMQTAGARITTTESALFELLERCDSDEFKTVAKLVKKLPVP